MYDMLTYSCFALKTEHETCLMHMPHLFQKIADLGSMEKKEVTNDHLLVNNGINIRPKEKHLFRYLFLKA